MKFILKLGGPCCSVPSRPKYLTTFQMLAEKLGGYSNNLKFYHSSNGLNWIEGQNSNGQTKAIVLANNDYLFLMNITNNVYSSSTDSISNNLNIEEYLGLLKLYSSIEYYYPSETLSLVGLEVYTQAIAPQGDVQIFKDAACTEYATGEVSKVYARVNKPWNFGGCWVIDPANASYNFTAGGPDREYPTNTYNIQCFTDFASESYNKPFEVGQVVECLLFGQENIVDVIDVTSFNKIFSNPALPVEGDVQIFGNRGCTDWPDGLVDTVYVRINKPWEGIDSGWQEYYAANNNFYAMSPATGFENDPYTFNVAIDFIGPESNNPFIAGEVVKAITSGGKYDVSNINSHFSKSQ